MADQENIISELEDQFPPMSGIAFTTARQQVLDSGLSVLQSEAGIIYEVFPDGTRRRVKEIEPPTPVSPGLKVSLR